MDPQRTSARLRPDWDATITYDVLAAPADAPGVFVGREDLLRPLEAAMREPDKRGTVLVSGYRGSGKTTLVIEALRRTALAFAKQPEAGRPKLLPVVLNVSEVSTSLTAHVPDAKAKDLQIDPRRLLIALLRAFRQRQAALGADAMLWQRIERLYDKATAAEFKLAQSENEARETQRVQEAGIKVDSAELLKGALLPAGLLSLGLASLGAADTLLDQVVKAVAAAGAVGSAAVGVSLASKRTDKRTTGAAASWQAVHDNSLQQLEYDLKDLLQALRDGGWRTVIVLEELDKLDGAGEELDAVIRYFKNLFTQAPALFVFLTDKVYFDRIAHDIRTARRGRSYALAHTFFTQRMFVGRPGTRDCLAFVERLLVDEEDCAVVRAVYTQSRYATESYASRSSAPGASVGRLSLFVRVLLFRSSNHLFDLKAELQRHVRATPDGPVLQFDDDMFPPEEQVLAKFQDLLAEKARTFAIKGGRAYANEVLHDALAGVFQDQGSTRPCPESALFAAGADGADDGLLDPAERRRVDEAVQSLLADLARGGALRRHPAGPERPAAEIEWIERPAEAFWLVRSLESHEMQLVGDLRQWALRASDLAQFAGPWDLADQARALADEWALRAGSISDPDTQVGVDEALQIARDAELRYADLLARTQDRLGTWAADTHGLRYEPLAIGSREPGDGLRLLSTADGDPRAQTQQAGRGLVVLAEGMHVEAIGELRRLCESHRLQRVVVVNVLAAPLPGEDRIGWQARWEAAFAGLPGWWQGQPLHAKVVVLDAARLGTVSPDDGAEGAVGVLAAELLAAAVWAVRPRDAADGSPHDALRLAEGVAGWLAPEGLPGRRVLNVQGLNFDRLYAAVAQALWIVHADAPPLVPTQRSPAFIERLLGGPTPSPQVLEQRERGLAQWVARQPCAVMVEHADELLGPAPDGRVWLIGGPALDRPLAGERQAEAALDVTVSGAPIAATLPVTMRWGTLAEPLRSAA